MINIDDVFNVKIEEALNKAASMDKFGIIIKKYVEKSGKSLEDISKESEVDIEDIQSLIDTGKMKNYNQLKNITDTLGLDFVDIMLEMDRETGGSVGGLMEIREKLIKENSN